MLKKISFLLLLFSVIAKADIQSHQQYYPFLSKGFNIHNYQLCKKFIQSCPVDIFPEPSCVEKIFQTKQVCQQFAKLTDVIGTQFITVKQIAKFFLITQTFPGDGQNSYYLLSKGYLIDTSIDPRNLDLNLGKKYKKNSFFIVNWDEPHYQKNKQGSQSFLAQLRITEGCLACPSIAIAEIEFQFNKKGDYLFTKLKSFKLISDP